ncbi:MAG: hypothetical protein ACPGJS_07405 [Flammeovirgaceae bacterium]
MDHWKQPYSLQYIIFIMMCVIGSSCQPKDTPPFIIEVVGENYEWIIRYAGTDGLLHTADDKIGSGAIYAPANSPVQIHLTSRDNLYFWFLNEFDQKGLAMIDREELLTFKTNGVGEFPVEADQFCGFSHESLHINFVVLESEEFMQQIQKK